MTQRDITPRNILVAARDTKGIHVVLWTDIGLLKKGSQLQTQCGTPTYYAPEVVCFQGSVGAHLQVRDEE